MTQYSLFDSEYSEPQAKENWTVSELTMYLREIIEYSGIFANIWVSGEVSNLSRPASGHLYFTLKDRNSVLKCVMWRSDVNQLINLPKEGDAIEVHGSIRIYEAAGQYQLYVDDIRPIGQGFLYKKFLELKEKLRREGLFEESHKRSIPTYPTSIGIVTSPTGAAIQDMLNTLKRRYTLSTIIIAATPVQGDEAPEGIISAISALNSIAKPDVILLARGGGSIEDLWAFNDENVARAIYHSKAPVITGVGHETDYTIADFVSDLRAPTPTAAAELAVPDREELQELLNKTRLQLVKLLENKLLIEKQKINSLQNRLMILSPQSYLRLGRQRLDELTHRMQFAINHRIEIKRTKTNTIYHNLNALNPISILNRGYAIVSTPDDQIIRSITQVNINDIFFVHLSDGKFKGLVKEKRK